MCVRNRDGGGEGGRDGGMEGEREREHGGREGRESKRAKDLCGVLPYYSCDLQVDE